TQGSILVQSAAASAFFIAGFPSPVSSGTTGSFTVTAKDPYDNVVTGYTGTVHLSSSDPQAVLPSDATLSNGTGLFSATLKTAGYQSITATDTQTATITGAQAGIRVVPLASITGPSAGALNQTLTYTLQASGEPAGTVFTFAIDWNGDGIVDQSITGPSGTQVTHRYGGPGGYTIHLTTTDPGSFTSPVA